MSQGTINWKNLQGVTNIQIPLLIVLKDESVILWRAIVVTNSLWARENKEAGWKEPIWKRKVVKELKKDISQMKEAKIKKSEVTDNRLD